MAGMTSNTPMRLAGVALCAGLWSILTTPPALAVTLAVSCSAVAVEFRLCTEAARQWAEQTGNEVRMISTPASASERLALYQQLLAAQSAAIDVLQIDVVWPGILGSHLVDLSPAMDGATRQAHFPATIDNNTIDGRLVAMPWFTNVGLLYYRRDLLERYGRPVPDSWVSLAETARVVMEGERSSGRRLWGYVFQARAYEGLTVNALEWVGSFGGGTIIDRAGRVTINNPAAIEAIDGAASWMRRITPPGVLNYAEEETRGVFQTGRAVFMRNWPYAWPLVNGPDSPVRGLVGVALLPRGREDGSAAILGGEGLAVSRYSRHPQEAASLVRYLVSRAEQKRRAIEGGFNPTIGDLYDDPEVLATTPLLRTLRRSFEEAAVRPAAQSGSRYNQVSARFWSAVHAVLSAQMRAGAALARLERDLARIGFARR